MNLDQFKATYFQECEELLQVMEENLMAIQDGNHEPDVLHAVFRAVHSIKGGAGAFGFAQLVGFAHTLETVLDHLRDGRLAPDPGVVTVLLSAGDILTDLVRAAQSDIEMPADHGESVRGELDELTRGGPAGEDEEVQLDFEGIDFTPIPIDEDDDGAPAGEAPQLDFDGIDFEPVPVDLGELTGDGWRIRFAPRDELLRNANEPLLLMRELARLGPLDVTADRDAIPDLSDIDPARAYLSWTMILRAPVARDAVEEVFEFVQDDCALDIEPWRADEDDGGGGGGGEPPPREPEPEPEPEPRPKASKAAA
ncbi:MAG: Hpt domain-containing protein, partial [Alphaproteobacteria bacterium]|nr:Hpt domain-containing protein [Alphaproteobacteria bacterium]